jgi:hypothetical protein
LGIVGRWCRVERDADDVYTRFMAEYGARLLEGLADRHDEAWLKEYFGLLRATQEALPTR